MTDTLDSLRAERDALAVSLAAVRKAAANVVEDGCLCEGEQGCHICAALETLDNALTATASPAEHGARVIEQAEERGARWMRAWAVNTVQARSGWSAASDVDHIDDAEVCRTAREPKGTR